MAKHDWPQKLDQRLQLSWDVPLDHSYSGPVIVDRLVITTESQKKTDERVVAFDRKTGEQRWESTWPGSMSVPFFAASNGSWIRSTPVTDGTRLFVAGMCDYLVCLKVTTGEKLYDIDFKERFKTPMPAFGQVCSPLLDNDRLYIQSGGGVLCLDATTGGTIWRALVQEDAMMGSTFRRQSSQHFMAEGNSWFKREVNSVESN